MIILPILPFIWKKERNICKILGEIESAQENQMQCILEKHKAQWNYLYPSEKEVPVWSVLTQVLSLGPGSGPSPFRFCAGGFVHWQHDCQGFPAFPLSDLTKAGGWAAVSLPSPPAQKHKVQLNPPSPWLPRPDTGDVTVPFSGAVWTSLLWWCDGILQWEDWARGALHNEQIYMPNFPGLFFF